MNKRKIEEIIEAAEYETNFYQDWQEYVERRSSFLVDDLCVTVQERGANIYFYVMRDKRIFKDDDGDIYDLTESENMQLVSIVNIDYFRSF